MLSRCTIRASWPRTTTLLLASLLVVLAVGCSRSRTITTNVFHEGRVEISLVEDVRSGSTVKRGLAHPRTVTAEEMTRAMGRLRFSDPVFMWKETDRPVFTEAEIATMAPQIAAAFAKANPDQMVGFRVKTWKKDRIFGSDKLTSGLVYAEGNGIHWAFANLNFTESTGAEPYLGSPLEASPRDIRLAPQAQQEYFRPQHPAWHEPKLFTNRLVDASPFSETGVAAAPDEFPGNEPQEPAAVATIAPATDSAPAAKEAPAPGKSTEQTPAVSKVQKAPAANETQNSASDRLRQLKALQKEGLISAQDYETKKKEILKDL